MAVLVDIKLLKCHEETIPERLKEVEEEIRSAGAFRWPIVVDRKTNVILDGMHRYAAACRLGLKRIPVEYVDYDSPDIKVLPWRDGETITKEMVVNAGLTGKLFPPKTSKHVVKTPNGFVHISKGLKEVRIPLEELR